MGGLDWRALLSQPATASVVVKKSPFDVKKRDAGAGTGQGNTTPASSTAVDAQQADTTEHPEAVVPIVLLKAAMPQQPVERFDRSKVPEDPLRKLRELQQLISDSLAAAAEVAKQGELKEQQQQDQQQQQQGADIDDPYLRRPVPPPQHAADQDDCYFWSGSRTSQYSDGTTAAAAGTAGAGADQDGGPGSSTQRQAAGSSTQRQAAGSSSRGPGNTAAQSMDTSATTRVPASQGSTEVFSTARSPAEKWGSALLRLKQLQLETVEALDVQD